MSFARRNANYFVDFKSEQNHHRNSIQSQVKMENEKRTHRKHKEAAANELKHDSRHSYLPLASFCKISPLYEAGDVSSSHILTLWRLLPR